MQAVPPFVGLQRRAGAEAEDAQPLAIRSQDLRYASRNSGATLRNYSETLLLATGLNYRSSARRRTEGDEDDDRAGSEDERPSTAPARKSLGRAASDSASHSASDSHSSTWRKFSISKLFAKHAPPGSDDDDGSPSKAEGLTMSGMMRETEKR